MVEVYSHRALDSGKGESCVAPHKRTAEAIGRLRGGEIIPGTEEEVASALIDSEGRYMPEWSRTKAH